MFISINDYSEMSLYGLEYGIDSLDKKNKYFATYVYDDGKIKCFAEIKSEKPLLFEERETVVRLKSLCPSGVRFRIEGVVDYGK